MNKLRMDVKAAIQRAIDEATGSRKYQLHIDPMRVQIFWFTGEPCNDKDPDLDNITTPFLNALEGAVITNDRQFQEVHLRKIELNHQLEPEPDRVFDARAASATEFVYVRVEPLEWDVPIKVQRSTGC